MGGLTKQLVIFLIRISQKYRQALWFEILQTCCFPLLPRWEPLVINHMPVMQGSCEMRNKRFTTPGLGLKRITLASFPLFLFIVCSCSQLNFYILNCIIFYNQQFWYTTHIKHPWQKVEYLPTVQTGTHTFNTLALDWVKIVSSKTQLTFLSITVSSCK